MRLLNWILDDKEIEVMLMVFRRVCFKFLSCQSMGPCCVNEIEAIVW